MAVSVVGVGEGLVDGLATEGGGELGVVAFI